MTGYVKKMKEDGYVPVKVLGISQYGDSNRYLVEFIDGDLKEYMEGDIFVAPFEEKECTNLDAHFHKLLCQ